MQGRFTEVIERLTGREVVAFMSASHQRPDLQMEVFVLDGPPPPRTGEPPPPGAPRGGATAATPPARGRTELTCLPAPHPAERPPPAGRGGRHPAGARAPPPTQGDGAGGRGGPNKVERGAMRLVATGGIIGIAVALGAILVGQDVAGWIVGLVIGLTTVILAALLWSSRHR